METHISSRDTDPAAKASCVDSDSNNIERFQLHDLSSYAQAVRVPLDACTSPSDSGEVHHAHTTQEYDAMTQERHCATSASFDKGCKHLSDDGVPAHGTVKTFVRQQTPQELVRSSSQPSARGVKIDVVLQSVMHCGGGMLKGRVEICWDARARHAQQTQITAVKLDCLGIESTKANSKMFLAIAQDLVASHVCLGDLTKVYSKVAQAKQGFCSIPFEMQLPLDVGPGTFGTTGAQIDYTFVCTVQMVNAKRFADGQMLRLSRTIKVYPCLNPTKALLPTPAPIDASEERKLRFGGKETLKVAARIHRPAWISGQTAYVEVHITNDSKRMVKKVTLNLLRHLSFFKNSAATAGFQSVDCRVPERTLTKIVSSNVTGVQSGKSANVYWKGVKRGERDTTLFQIEVPSGELSIQAGRFFETKYFIHIVVSTGGGEVCVELPITIMHINSLDIMPSEAKAVANMVQIYADKDDCCSETSGANISNHVRRHSVPSRMGELDRQELFPRRQLIQDCSVTAMSIAGNRLAAAKPGIQSDLRRALSLDYQSKFSKLDISSEQASYTRGAHFSERSMERQQHDGRSNLADRLVCAKKTNMNFHDIL